MWICVKLLWEHKAPASINTPSIVIWLLLALKNTQKQLARGKDITQLQMSHL